MNEGKAVVNGDFAYFEKSIQLGNLMGFVQKTLTENDAAARLTFKKENNVAVKTASLLAEGYVVGWFQGESEFGPRALGHRSILADPRKKNLQKFINNKVKFREDFRPFAPAVLEDRVSDIFEFSGTSPYMIVVAPIKEQWKETLSGIVHVDGSCRIQTVNNGWNDRFFDLLKEFARQTGIPVLLNTSFNCKGMPIIETPSQALNYFFTCELDFLILGDFVVSKEEGYHTRHTKKEAGISDGQIQ